MTGAYTNVKSSEASVKYFHKGKKSFTRIFYHPCPNIRIQYILLLVAIFGIYLPGNDGSLDSLLFIGIVSLKYHDRRKNSSEFEPLLQIFLSLWPVSNL